MNVSITVEMSAVSEIHSWLSNAYRRCIVDSILSYSYLLILFAILVSSFITTCHVHNIISAISKSCFHIRPIGDLRRSRTAIDQTTACTIAIFLIRSKIDYCNSLFLNLFATQTNRLQLVLNSAARVLAKTPKFHHITLESIHRLKIKVRIIYKVLSHA